MAEKPSNCPWQVTGEDTGGYTYWCEKCGCIRDSNNSVKQPWRLDADTLYCPDQGYVP